MMGKIYGPYATPWAPAWGARTMGQAANNYGVSYGYGWASPSTDWYGRPVDGLSEQPGQLGLLPALAVFTGVAAVLADRLGGMIEEWRRPETTAATVEQQAESFKLECLRQVQAGTVTMQECQALSGVIARERQGGLVTWLQKTFSENATPILVGVITTVGAAVLLRAILR